MNTLNLYHKSDAGLPMKGHVTIVPSAAPIANFNLHSDTGFNITINYCGREYNLNTNQADVNLLDMMYFEYQKQNTTSPFESLEFDEISKLMSQSKLMKDFVSSNQHRETFEKKSVLILEILPIIELLYGEKFIHDQAIAKGFESLSGSTLETLGQATQSLIFSFLDAEDTGLAAESNLMGEEEKAEE